MDRTIQPVAAGPGVIVGSWSTDDGALLLAAREDAWGFVGNDGTFTATTDLPAVYQRTGRERPAGVDAHTLGSACDSGQPGECFLVESRAPEDLVATWWRESEERRLADHAWAVDGRGVLLMLTSGMVGDRIQTELTYAVAPEDRTVVGRVDVPDWVLPAILGISAEPTAGHPTITAIGDSDGSVVAFVLDDGTVRPVDGIAWFAGWADDPTPYDPD